MKQPKCPSREDWVKTMWYIYVMEYYSAMKRNRLGYLQRCEWTQRLSHKVSQRKTNTVCQCIYMESRKMIQMNLFANCKQTHKRREPMYGGKGKGWDGLGDWD